MDCFHCSYDDCINDNITLDEIKASNTLDNLSVKENKEPSSDYREIWRKNNLERDKKNKHRHYTENKSRYSNNQRRYQKEHADELREKRRAYYEENKEYIKLRREQNGKATTKV
jgi:hypothetical protein